MDLKVMQKMAVIPRSVEVSPLSDANFEQVLMTNAMTTVEKQQQRHSATRLAELLVSGSNTADALSTTKNAYSQENEENIIKEITTLGQGDKDKEVTVPNTDRDSDAFYFDLIFFYNSLSFVEREPISRVSIWDPRRRLGGATVQHLWPVIPFQQGGVSFLPFF